MTCPIVTRDTKSLNPKKPVCNVGCLIVKSIQPEIGIGCLREPKNKRRDLNYYKTLIEKEGETPIIIGGDLNIDPKDKMFKEIKEDKSE